MSPIVLSNEVEAWAVLESCLDDDSFAPCLRFEGWPSLEVRLQPGHGKITPDIRRALTLFETGIYRAYAMYRYGSPDLRQLTALDRAQLAPEIEVLPGSTRVIFDLARAATHFLRSTPNKMSGSQQLIATLGLGLLAFSCAAWVSWLYFNADWQKEQAHAQAQTELAAIHLEMSKEHTKQMKLLARAYERDASDTLHYAATDFVPWRPALLEAAESSGTILVGEIEIPGSAAKAVAKTARAVATKQRKIARKEVAPAIETGWITETLPARLLPVPPMHLEAA